MENFLSKVYKKTGGRKLLNQEPTESEILENDVSTRPKRYHRKLLPIPASAAGSTILMRMVMET